MDVLGDFKRSLKFLGITDISDKFRPIAFVHIAFHGVLLINVIFFLQTKWADIDDRFTAFKALIYVITFLGFSMSIICFWKDFSQVLAMFDNMHFKFPYRISVQRENIFQTLKVNMRKFNNILWRMITIYVVFTTIIPVFIVVLRVTLFSGDFQKIIKESSVTPFPLYYPEFITKFRGIEGLLNSLVYLLGHSFESAYMLMSGYKTHLAIVVPLCAMANVEFEFKLLSLSLREMEDLLGESIHSSYINTDQCIRDETLKKFLKYFVRYHQNTCRKFDGMKKGTKFIALVYSSMASLYICMSLYTIVQKEQIILKLQEAVFSAVWANAMFLFCMCGERVKIENETFRNALYECNWLDKPTWFKKSLLIIMARADRPVDIKPFGLYGFSLNRFATTMNAAYCYYNVLSKMKVTDYE